MNCPACRAANPPPAKYCLECGTALPPVCSACQTRLPPGSKFCCECGTPLTPPAVRPEPETAPVPLASPPGAAESAASDAERRQMTVLFADMVGSTGMSTWVDPEDYREIIAGYIEAVETVVRRYDGYVANYLGDGILVYFGYPRAHEEDSRRACLAALDMVGAVRALNVDTADGSLELAVRVGIHTGTTVIGGVGGGNAREVMAVGETLNIAARLQTFADPNTVIISATTERLVRGFFTTRSLGLQALRGLSGPVALYQLVGLDQRAGEGSPAVELSPLVGRDLDLEILRGRWQESVAGRGRVVVLTGEAGLGKSRLIRALRAELNPPVTWLHCRGTPFYSDSPLHPVIEALPTVLGLTGPTADFDHLREHLVDLGVVADDAAPLLGGLLGLAPPEEGARPPGLSPQMVRKRTLQLLVEVLVGMARRSPLAFVGDDVHWFDDTTLELTDLLSEQVHSAPLFMLLAGRPGFQPPFVVDSDVVLRGLAADQVAVLARNVAATTLPFEILDQIAAKAEGNPLYVEELTRNILDMTLTGPASAPGDGPPGTVRPVEIPASLHELLLARLDRASGDRTVIQAASAVGRVFSYRLLGEVLSVDDDRLRDELDRHVDAGVLYVRGAPPDATYTFRHVLFRDAAYDSMTRRVRRQVHAAIAATLKRTSADAAPEVLAHHLGEAGDKLEAVRYWAAAGEAALGSFALKESMNHLRRGLALLAGDDSHDAVQTELSLRTTLGVPLMLTGGFASSEVGDNYTRLLERCEAVGHRAVGKLFPALWGLWTFYEVGGQLAKAQDMAQRLLDLADGLDDPAVRLGGHIAFGAARLLRGDLDTARLHFESGVDLCDATVHGPRGGLFGQDPGAMCASFLTWVHAHEGDVDRGRTRAEQAEAICREVDHPATWAFVHAVLASFGCLVGDYEEGERHARRVISLGEQQGMPHWEAQGYCNLGWALQGEGRFAAAVDTIGRGLDGFNRTGTRAARSYFEGALVEAHLGGGDLDEAHRVLTDLFVFINDTDERFYEAELWRLHGEVAAARGGTGRLEAVTSFRRAAHIATAQGAGLFARRADERLAAAAC